MKVASFLFISCALVANNALSIEAMGQYDCGIMEHDQSRADLFSLDKSGFGDFWIDINHTDYDRLSGCLQISLFSDLSRYIKNKNNDSVYCLSFLGPESGRSYVELELRYDQKEFIFLYDSDKYIEFFTIKMLNGTNSYLKFEISRKNRSDSSSFGFHTTNGYCRKY